MESKVYNQSGKEVGKVELSAALFGVKWNADLVHQVVTSMKTAMRTNVAHTKGRGEVRGGGKKPWRQKGTGRARHGSTRSPIWVGGGVAHGPTNEKNFFRKVNRSMKAKALYTILSQKYREGEIIFVDNFDFKTPKTAQALSFFNSFANVANLEGVANKKNNKALIAIPAKSVSVEKSFRNFNNVLVSEARNMNPLDIMSYKYLIIADPKASLAALPKLKKS